VHALRRIFEAGRVPILILADGILEYRNLYEHPELADGSIFQPIIGHKLACIGRGQSRIIESWGNVGKCEVVGLPRLDSLGQQAFLPIQDHGPFRLLIATANTPAFNDRQRQAVTESLEHIRLRLEANPRIHGRELQVRWRLTDGLNEELGLPADDGGSPQGSQSIVSAIENADAVITTPSTLYLESVLLGRPTAILDFHNTPHFVPAAWMINAPKHLNVILNELANPPAAKLLFQNTVLHDQLELREAASDRMIELIEAMVQSGAESRQAGRPVALPPRILNDPQRGFARVEDGFSLKSLFPNNPVLNENEPQALQLELNLAISRLQGLPDEIVQVENRIQSLRDKYETLQNRYQDTRARLMKARVRIANYIKMEQQGKNPPVPGPDSKIESPQKPEEEPRPDEQA
jgi:hypothetical protein